MSRWVRARVMVWGLAALCWTKLSVWCKRRADGCSARMLNTMAKTMTFTWKNEPPTAPPQP